MDCGILYVFSYDGALQGTPRISNQRLTTLTADHVTAAKEVIAARNPSDGKSIHCCHYRTGKPVYSDKPLVHSGQVTKLELDPGSPTGDQLLAFTDAARDLYLLSLSSGLNRVRSSLKIGTIFRILVIHHPLSLEIDPFCNFFFDMNLNAWFSGSWRCDVVRLELRLFHAGYDKRRRIVCGALSTGRIQRSIAPGEVHHSSEHPVHFTLPFVIQQF